MTRAATTRPATAGATSSRYWPPWGADPKLSRRIQSIAMRKATTSVPEITPMKMERTRKSLSSRVGAILSMVAERLVRGCGSRGSPGGGDGGGGEEMPEAAISAMVAPEGGIAAICIGGSGIGFLFRYSCSTAAGCWAMRSRRASFPAGGPQTPAVRVSVSQTSWVMVCSKGGCCSS